MAPKINRPPTPIWINAKLCSFRDDNYRIEWGPVWVKVKIPEGREAQKQALKSVGAYSRYLDEGVDSLGKPIIPGQIATVLNHKNRAGWAWHFYIWEDAPPDIATGKVMQKWMGKNLLHYGFDETKEAVEHAQHLILRHLEKAKEIV